MIIEQIYTGCLAQGAYYVQSDGEAVVIDPLREVEPYLRKAEKNNARITYVFETHFHADFVSGHIDLSRKSGAQIVYGPNAKPSFDAIIATDGQQFKVGKLTFKVLHTPGHTMESACYLLKDENGKDIALFSGDTLFIGDVGRPDLAQKAANMTQEELAGTLFDSLRTKIMTLADDIIIYPAHGAGSACGKNMSNETTDTLGNQKKNNYALRPDMTKEQFIKEVTQGLTTPPAYFPLNVMMNREGYEPIVDVMERGNHAFSPDEFEAAANETGAVIIDTRRADVFAKGFIPNSINIGIDGSFAPWVGALLPDIKQKILLVTDPGVEQEVITRLARVGYDFAIGYLEGGFASWKNSGKEVDTIKTVGADELAKQLQKGQGTVLDVRKSTEYEAEHVDGAINVPLDYINDHFAELNKNKTHYVHCAGGYRSMIFSSILKARGFTNIVDVSGGFKAIKDAREIPLTNFVCAANANK